ncbi:MAG TPA: hypothetical protein VGG39_17630 [Polyangiaceae bacterium]|jgi:hypothetical protein
MRSLLPLLTAGLLAQVALAACGGIAAAPADGGSSSGSGGAGSGATGSGSGGTGASSGSSSGGSSSGGANADGGSVGSDAGNPDATSNDATTSLDAPASDVVSLPDAPAPAPAVSCPQDLAPATCNAGQYCCVVGDGHAGTQTDTCQDDAAKCAGTPVRCAVPADCPAPQVCCGTEQTIDGGTSYTDVTCATSCSGANQRAFCDPLDNTCPIQHPTCAISTILPGYNVCNQ